MSTTTDSRTPRGTAAPADVRPARGRDRFVSNAAFVLAGLLVGVQVLAAHVIPPLAVFAGVYVALGLTVRTVARRWPVIVTVVVALLHVGGSYEFFAANLAHPESPASFIFEAAVLIAGLTLIIGAVLGMRGAGPGGRRPLAVGAVALAAVAVVTSLVAASRVEADARQPGDVAIEAERSLFTTEVEATAGDATLWIDNQDAFHHTFLIEGTDVRVVLPGSSAVRVDVALAAGTYRYWCDVPGHDEMEGELVVR